LDFDGRERLDAYIAALQAVIARHDILRTAVAWDGLREPVQVVWRHAPLVVAEVDLTGAEGDAAAALHESVDPRRQRIDVGRAPLIRGYAARDRANGRWLLMLRRHHLTSDHTTLEVLQAEVEAFANGRAGDLPAPLPFRNFVAQARSGVSRAEHELFFSQLLGDVDEPTAPFGLLDVRGDAAAIGEARLDVDAALADRLRARARALGVSAASLFHVAFAQVLARASGRADVVFGTVLFGRMRGDAGADRVTGVFINTLPVRIAITQGAAAGVRGTHALLADLIRHEHASLALAQRESGVRAPLPLFTALLNYRYTAAGHPSAVGDGPRAVYTEERTNYPLTLSVDDLGDGFRLNALLPERVGAARVCEMVHAALQGLADALETAPATPLGALDVLPARERSLVLDEWNKTETEWPRESCIHELFEAQAERTPDAVAVVHDERTLTYAELNRGANRLAHHLRELGVEPDARVAICVERGAEMVVALLSVLKAGGAYVPLDPAYPEDRLRYMLADSAPRAVL
ncbi:MAG TPA: AMP-binding protein, partial [Longimicrobium sp.]